MSCSSAARCVGGRGPEPEGGGKAAVAAVRKGKGVKALQEAPKP